MTHTPLLLIPGLMCDHAVWEPLLPVLARHAQPHVVDHGNADNLTRMAERLLAQAPAQFALAGHSMGGRVALEVLRLAPRRVLRLSLMDTGFLPRANGLAGEEEARKRHALLELARSQGVGAMARAWVQGMVHPERLNDTRLMADIIGMFERKSADLFERQIRALLDRPDATPVLQGVSVPTLVLCGRQDIWSSVAQHQGLAALIPDEHAKLQVIEETGHMSTMEQPAAVAHAMAAWLAAPARATA